LQTPTTREPISRPTISNHIPLNDQVNNRVREGGLSNLSLEQQIDNQVIEDCEIAEIRQEVANGKGKSQYSSKQLEFLDWCQRNSYPTTVTSTKIMQFVKNEVNIT
jgi:hypothetical protein